LTAAVAAVVTAAACSGGGSEFRGLELDAREFRFQPSQVAVTAGRQVTIRLVNKGRVTHNLSIPGANVDLDLPAGKSKTVIFVPEQSTSPVEFFCRFHRGEGMTGSFRVE
jgi:plastocyanin